MAAREFDVVVLGATGVTGRNVAAYLADRCSRTGLRWAAAARDAARLDRVLDAAGIEAPAIIADVTDAGSLRSLAERARVVVNVAGPYALYADPVIEACVAHGCHYLDLTGEIQFVRRTIHRHDARARAAGVKVVQVCGFEALPADLGVLLACEAAREAFGAGLVRADVDMGFTRWAPGPMRPRDTLSGGTIQSIVRAAGDADAEFLCDPGALLQDPAAAAAVRATHRTSYGVRRSATGAFVTPMLPFAFINPPVIHRTRAILAAERGEAFAALAYREGAAISPDVLRPVRSAAAGLMIGLQIAVHAISRSRPSIRRPVSRALASALPGSGFGPARDRLEPWGWRFSILGRTASGEAVQADVDGDGHPGYLATARMIGEAGLMVATPGATPERFGCLTPATALGTASIDRLRHAGVRFALASSSAD